MFRDPEDKKRLERLAIALKDQFGAKALAVVNHQIEQARSQVDVARTWRQIALLLRDPPVVGVGKADDVEEGFNVSFERLAREHNAIDALCTRLADISDADAPAAELASGLLASLAQLVDDHLRYENVAIYDVLADRYGESKDISPEGFRSFFRILTSDWSEYLSDWTIERVWADWPNFCHDTTAMMPRLQERVRTETWLIYPMALQDDASSPPI